MHAQALEKRAPILGSMGIAHWAYTGNSRAGTEGLSTAAGLRQEFYSSYCQARMEGQEHTAWECGKASLLRLSFGLCFTKWNWGAGVAGGEGMGEASYVP